MPCVSVKMVSDLPLTVAVAVCTTAELVVAVVGVAGVVGVTACVEVVGVLCTFVVEVELLPVVVELPHALTNIMMRIAVTGMSRRV